MMSLWDALRMNMMISYQELVRTFLNILQQNEINDISERTLKARKDKAKYWLMQWPSQLPLIS